MSDTTNKMRNQITILLVLLSACGGQTEKKSPSLTNILTDENTKSKNSTEFNWIGTVNNKIPVFIHYLLHDKLIIGEITYLNTKDKSSIKLLGTIEADKSYRLLEFLPDGNITGIITGKPEKQIFSGEWFSPKTRKEFQLNLKTKDTTLGTSEILPISNEIFGNYHYQYSEDGYQGDFEINKLNDNKIAFSIFSVTGAPGHNIAEVPTDTIQMNGNNFVYKIPETDSCEFRVTFYKDFLTVAYTKGYCAGQFGWNATIDGIFLKVKK